MLKAIHAQEDKEAALEKVEAIAEKLEQMKLKAAAERVREIMAEILAYYDFPSEHWRRIRTNNPLALQHAVLLTYIVDGADGHFALMLVAARLRYVAGTRWGTRRYLRMELLNEHREAKETAA